MKVPLSWLQDYVELPDPLDISVLVERLDLSGTKVEEVHLLGEGVRDVVVAEVLNISEHPNADSLTLVEVRTAPEDSQTVVCGARNISVGDKVPLARVGSKLGDLEITARKIRGQTSAGMLCSSAELGVAKDHSGILVLQPDSELGSDVADLLGLGQVVVELEITPNRPDCMSLVGVAREIAGLYGLDLRVPEMDPERDGPASPVAVDVRDPQGCPRYLARYLEEVEVAPSPGWLAARLLAAGFRPISNIVDVTNYVLLETGQPLHAFDANEVTDSTIVVRRADDGESITTLDGEERKLDRADLVIADPSAALAIAGVMGGLESEVSANTTSVILESAAFDKASVAFTSRRLGLRSEASARFERGSDPQAVPSAAERAVRLMEEVSGASASASANDVYPHPVEREIVALRPRRTEALLGFEVPVDRQISLLRSIGLDASGSEERIEVSVPTFRRDLRIEADLIEEVARLEGFDRLPSTLPKGAAGGLSRAQKTDRIVRRTLVAAGMTEAWTGSFSSPEDLDALGYPDDHPGRMMVTLANPMLDHEPTLRTTLYPGLLRSLALNHSSHRPSGAALFEVARIYQPSDKGMAEETEALAGVMSGRRRMDWRGGPTQWDFFEGKGVLEAAIHGLGIPEVRFTAISDMPYHPTRAAAVLFGREPIGTLGEFHPDVCARFEVPEGTIGFEISMEALIAARPEGARTGDLPRFPSAFVDLAFVVDGKTPAAALLDVIRAAGAPSVVAVELFDIYVGEQVPAGKKSLAFSLEMRDEERTLSDDDVQRARDRIVGAVAERLGGELRA